ncbi:ribonuclease H-like domain-containing protein [Pilobolus umbonatus]|nr:ribonuclease H-like domain-containing protein [Pilobolus umbonatus]
MEIPRQQFLDKLSYVEEAIKECDFMAIDTELSGLNRPATTIRLYSMDNRYKELKEATDKFLIIQFGLCTFKWSEIEGRYIAKPFNFYIFPTGITGQVQMNRVFSVQAQAFDFLVKQSFDFNKWVYQGIPYMTQVEEKQFILESEQKMSDNIPNIPIDDKEREFIKAAMASIEEWVQNENNEDSEGINISCKNAYQRRLIYQEVRNNYKDLTAVGMQGFIRVVKYTQKQKDKIMKEKRKKFEVDCESAIGFRKVIKMISKSGKIMVGHNVLLDVCHMVGQFIEPLPESVDHFKTLTHSVFPKIIDTKYMCSSEPELREIFGTGTSLENLRFETSRGAFDNPRIDMHTAFPRYLTDMAHEAGYDAYITGVSFLKLTSYLDQVRNPSKYEKEEVVEEEKPVVKKVDADGWEISDDEEEIDPNWTKDEEEIFNYGSIKVNLVDKNGEVDPSLSGVVNKTSIVRTGYECFDFVHKEPILNQSNIIYVQYEKDNPLTQEDAEKMFHPYGNYVVERNDDTSSFVVFENPRGSLNDVTPSGSEYKISPVSEYYKKN